VRNSVPAEARNPGAAASVHLPEELLMPEPRRPYDEAFLADCARIHRQWHERAKARDSAGLLALYAEDAVLETPLVQAIFDGRETGVLRGHAEIRPFFEEGARRRPNALVRWHRTGKWLTDGERLLVWEYPRAAPDGDQVDLVEVMEIAGGLIVHHRIYWGWFGTGLLTRAAAEKARR
jgi:steroid Delta-isomerase